MKSNEKSLSHRREDSDLASKKSRRQAVFAVLIFCAIIIGWITFKGTDSRLYETIAIAAFSLMGSTVGFYITGQVFDLKFSRKGK